MEQFFANQGRDYVNNGNGRESAATVSLLNSETGAATLTWWKEHPPLQTAIDQLHASKPSTASTGALMGVLQIMNNV